MQEKLRILSRRVHSNFQKTEIDTKEINVKCKGDAFYSIFRFQWNIFFCFVDKISYPKMPFHNMIVLGTLFVVWEWRIFFFVPPFTVKSTISPCFIYEIQIKFVFKNLEVSWCLVQAIEIKSEYQISLTIWIVVIKWWTLKFCRFAYFCCIYTCPSVK